MSPHNPPPYIPGLACSPFVLYIIITYTMKSTVAGQPEFSTASLMSQYCYQCKQVTCFKLLSQSTIERIRLTVYSLSETEQTQLVLNYMQEHSQDEGIVYSVGGHQVCETCFRKVYGFRYNRFAAIKAKFHNGILVAEHGRTGRCEITDSSIRVISWLRTFSEKVGTECLLHQLFICLLVSLKPMFIL